MTKIDLVGVHKVRKKKASGEVVEYHRTRRGKGAKTFWDTSKDKGPIGGVEYMAAYNAAQDWSFQQGPKPFKDLINAYLSGSKYAKLKPRTQRDIRDSIYHDRGISNEFAEHPLAAFNDPRILRRAISWRDKKWGTTRQADMKFGHLRGIVEWGRQNGYLLENHLRGVDKVYSNDRSHIIWTDEEIGLFCAPPVPEHAQRILLVVSETGLAPVDAVRLSRGDVKATPRGRRIEMRRAKTGVLASMPVTDKMAEILDSMPEGRERVLTNSHGKPWVHENQLGKIVSKWRDELGIRKELHLYDARGTAATRLLNAGLDLHEIALAMGWSISTASKMIETYAKVNPEITDAVLEKLRSSNRHAA